MGEGGQGAGWLAKLGRRNLPTHHSNVMSQARASLSRHQDAQKGHLAVTGGACQRQTKMPLDVWRWVICPGWWQLHKAFVWSSECTYCGKAAGGNQINIYLEVYILKFQWFFRFQHYSTLAELMISWGLSLLVHQWYERQELAQQENIILAAGICSDTAFSVCSTVSWCSWSLQIVNRHQVLLLGFSNGTCLLWSLSICTGRAVSCSFNREGNLRERKSRVLDRLLLCRESKQGDSHSSHPFPRLSLRWREAPPDRTCGGLVSLSLCCAKEPFAYFCHSRWCFCTIPQRTGGKPSSPRGSVNQAPGLAGRLQGVRDGERQPGFLSPHTLQVK